MFFDPQRISLSTTIQTGYPKLIIDIYKSRLLERKMFLLGMLDILNGMCEHGHGHKAPVTGGREGNTQQRVNKAVIQPLSVQGVGGTLASQDVLCSSPFNEHCLLPDGVPDTFAIENLYLYNRKFDQYIIMNLLV